MHHISKSRAGLQFWVCSPLLLLMGCLPQHLQKYQSAETKRTPSAEQSPALDPLADPSKGDRDFGMNAANSNSIGEVNASNHAVNSTPNTHVTTKANSSGGRPTPATIYAIDKHGFRFHLNERDVWDAAINVLLRNYNLVVVSKESGVITTEWDTYYLNQGVYRNKLSLRIRPGARGSVDLFVHNNTERLQDGAAAGTVGAVWLPADDVAREVARIVQNLALTLNQSPPVMPQGLIAQDALGVKGDAAR